MRAAQTSAAPRAAVANVPDGDWRGLEAVEFGDEFGNLLAAGLLSERSA